MQSVEENYHYPTANSYGHVKPVPMITPGRSGVDFLDVFTWTLPNNMSTTAALRIFDEMNHWARGLGDTTWELAADVHMSPVIAWLSITITKPISTELPYHP
jgi:hypothetical protein